MHQYKRGSHRRAAVRFQRQYRKRLRAVRQQGQSVGIQECVLRSGGGEAQAPAMPGDRERAYRSSHRSVHLSERPEAAMPQPAYRPPQL